MNIGDNIRQIRNKRGLKQANVEKEAGLPNSALSKIENGLRDPKVCDLFALAKVLDVSALDILTYPVHYVPEQSENCRVRAVIELDIADEERLSVLKEILHSQHLL